MWGMGKGTGRFYLKICQKVLEVSLPRTSTVPTGPPICLPAPSPPHALPPELRLPVALLGIFLLLLSHGSLVIPFN